MARSVPLTGYFAKGPTGISPTVMTCPRCRQLRSARGAYQIKVNGTEDSLNQPKSGGAFGDQQTTVLHLVRIPMPTAVVYARNLWCCLRTVDRTIG